MDGPDPDPDRVPDTRLGLKRPYLRHHRPRAHPDRSLVRLAHALKIAHAQAPPLGGFRYAVFRDRHGTRPSRPHLSGLV